MHRFQNGSSVNGKRWVVGNDVIRRWRKADRICSQIINDISFKHDQYFLCVLSAHTFRNYRYFYTQTITSFSLLLFTKFCGAHSACMHSIWIVHTSMESQKFNNHHGTLAHFLTIFTKTVKLTKTQIACWYRRWNSLIWDCFKKCFCILESWFPGRLFGKSMFDCKLKLCTHCNALVCVVMHVKLHTSMGFECNSLGRWTAGHGAILWWKWVSLLHYFSLCIPASKSTTFIITVQNIVKMLQVRSGKGKVKTHAKHFPVCLFFSYSKSNDPFQNCVQTSIIEWSNLASAKSLQVYLRTCVLYRQLHVKCTCCSRQKRGDFCQFRTWFSVLIRLIILA